jgi:hypothetical protein
MEEINEIRTEIINLIKNCDNINELNFAANYISFFGHQQPAIPANYTMVSTIVDALWDIDDIDEDELGNIRRQLLMIINFRKREIQLNKNQNIQKGGGMIKNNPWITHVKSFAKKHKTTLKDAMRNENCKSSYKSR